MSDQVRIAYGVYGGIVAFVALVAWMVVNHVRVIRRQARKTGERFRVRLVNGRRVCLLRSIYG